MSRILGIVLVILATNTYASAEPKTATLKMRFVCGGDEPVPKQTFLAKPGMPPVPDERFIVDHKTRGIRNIAVRLHALRSGRNIAKPQIKSKTVRLIAKNGRFEPRFLIANVGDTLELVDGGPDLHNPNVTFFTNMMPSAFVPAGATQKIQLVDSEPAVVPITCNIHSWMNAFLLIQDHPYVAVSEIDGSITIEGLPTGQSLWFRAWHESGTIDGIELADGSAITRGRFQVALQPGMNDLGDVEIPAEDFRTD